MAGTGSLRTYLGTAPGVGKTFSMLTEGRRRAQAGEKVVIGWLEPQDRAATSRLAEGLEALAPRSIDYRGAVFPDFDSVAAIASGADVVLVDELAHATPDRSRQRWEDVADVLAAGLDVVTTANVAHLRSVRDYAARITGVGTVEWVPDEFVRSGEVMLLDPPAEALRAWITAGLVYSAAQVGGALADYFRAANLEALSELARAWMAGTAEAVGDDLLVRRGQATPRSTGTPWRGRWPTPPRPRARPPSWSAVTGPAWPSWLTARYPPASAACCPRWPSRRSATPEGSGSRRPDTWNGVAWDGPPQP